MSLALVFSGQGTQHPGMLPWLADGVIVRAMQKRLGVSDWRAAVADGEWASRNAQAQVLLTGLALAAWDELARELPEPSAIAGYSVGELAAFGAAGVFDSGTALELAQQRAEAMDRCGERVPGGMLAVSGLSSAELDALCAAAGLALAIRNGPQSAVLAGPLAALDVAERAVEQRGARSTRLCIGVASHSPWMVDAARDFARTLERIELHRPRITLFSNAADRVHDATAARHALAAQIASTVRWDECMDNLHARQPACVLELGPGQALARRWNERHPEIPARSCDEFRSASGIVQWVRRQCGR
ncbi:acyltransferase domain-containing protein [Piscinibacter sp. XHJ-5]|uniref:acyltransferase domain-containing protein n=1 Tax=Piscinibacter sp. XHJ-5 TaxID=3037797 RepID=UPI0024534F6A|nr:acyltransferase domain-containing protein [Piscinibacter sp. XHJ-5]